MSLFGHTIIIYRFETLEPWSLSAALLKKILFSWPEMGLRRPRHCGQRAVSTHAPGLQVGTE